MTRIAKVADALRRHKSFLITSHINLEGDSVGSQIAMALLLKRLKKRYCIVDNDRVPKHLRFITAGEEISNDVTRTYEFEAFVALDCPVIERSGKVSAYARDAKTVFNIDHHVSNSLFGGVRWIEPRMSSCGEMMYRLYKEMGVPIDRKAARAMYVAILTDTGSFSYENTNAETHAIVSELLKSGIRPLTIGRQLNESKSIGELLLLRETLGTLRMHYQGRVATLYTSQAMLKRFRVGTAGTENFVNYARSIDTAKIAAFFFELPHGRNAIHVSFRSKGDVDVNEVAALFNGGGHPNASGCLIRGTLKYAQAIILSKLKVFI